MSFWIMEAVLFNPVVITALIQVVLGFLYAGAAEWFTHKYILHGYLWRKHAFFVSHWAVHHRAARKNNFYDPRYELGFWNWDARFREFAGVLLMLASHAVLLFWIPYFYITLCIYGFAYTYIHHKAHTNTIWGRKWFPHHVRHHMEGSQQAWFGVVTPLWDHILKSTKDCPPPSYKKRDK